ncbi:MAG: acyltransferase [Actinomycetota bacterium]|nr:acyltransferase [Actinomycetota bacterium]
MTAAADIPSRSRLKPLDGLRGIAIVLVVVSHGWTIWPTTSLDRNGALKVMFSSGNFAVSIFFVVGGFLAVRGWLRTIDAGRKPAFGLIAVRRFVRLSSHVYVMLALVLVIASVDTTDPYPKTEIRASVVHVLTYTWNDYLITHALTARPDLGHLWYLSVDFQVFLCLLALVYLLGRRRLVLVAVLLAILAVVVVWRQHSYATEGYYVALLRATTRMDGLVVGALAAAAMPYLGWLRRSGRFVAPVALVSLALWAWLVNSERGFFGPAALGLNITVALLVMFTVWGTTGRPVNAVLGWRPLTALGTWSLAIYVWHYPTFWFFSRHGSTWSWERRAVVALVVTGCVSALSQLVVERRTQRWLASPRWSAYHDGLMRGLAGQARQQISRTRQHDHAGK